jgi:hypothetical protein
MGDDNWFAAVLGFAPIAFGLAVGAAILIRRLTKADLADVKAKIESQGATVVWVKRLDTQGGGRGDGRVTYYDVLVERDGVRRIEVWREDSDGIFKDH